MSAVESIWRGRRGGVTIGAFALIFLAAVESLAVTTVMPIVSRDLHGEELYAVAFAGTLATGVIGMVAAGAWCDRAGPRGALYAATGLFLAGLVIAGAATTMPVLLVGRLVQGLGAGAQTVALYVVVARFYPPAVHGRVFAAFAAAWVVPSMVGPFLAGAVTEYLHWRWTFLGVAVLVAAAFVLVVLLLRDVDLGGGEHEGAGRGIGRRLLFAVMVAVGAVAIGFAVDAPEAWRWPLAVLVVLVIAVSIRPLLPVGALRAVRGLPSVVLMRGVVSGSFFAAEAYIPYLLIARFDVPPTVAGLALTLAAIAWSTASWLQGRFGDIWGSTRIAASSLVLLGIGMAAELLVALGVLPPAAAMIGWGFAGGGMGLLYPRLTVLTLADSTPTDQGFNSSALSISDSTGSAVAIAVAGIAFGSALIAGSGFPIVFLIAGGLVLLAVIPGLRLDPRHPHRG
ncbi:MFS transporter [Microbacterium sp. ASV81]|uniref:MFS transporter n=1 Tax=Microbacterium capsulatum TaxID=3041921 RepID=A0ABU0XDZ2_9MICO|nr:MFS transporter [Microbacterium sp. ASV81]MDQ4213326.1 MFS transporter [Microbacterium sp. ASV81]